MSEDRGLRNAEQQGDELPVDRLANGDDGVANGGTDADSAVRSPQSEVRSPQSVSRRRVLQVLGAAPLAGAMGLFQPAAAQHAHGTAAAPAQPRQPRQRNRFFTAREMRTLTVLADDIIPADERSPSASAVGVPAFIDFHLSVEETSEATRTAWRGGLAWLDTESRRRFGVGYAAARVAQRHAILDDISGPVGPPLASPNTPPMAGTTGTAPTGTAPGGSTPTRSPSAATPPGQPPNAAPAATAAAAAATAAEPSPALRYGTAFFARARDMVAAGFFSSPQGWKDLQYIGNVFHPNWTGCPQAALDKLGVSYAVMETRVREEGR